MTCLGVKSVKSCMLLSNGSFSLRIRLVVTACAYINMYNYIDAAVKPISILYTQTFSNINIAF